MRLTPPKKIVWIISLLLAIISLGIHLIRLFSLRIDFPVLNTVAPHTYWIMCAAWFLLFLGVKTKNL